MMATNPALNPFFAAAFFCPIPSLIFSPQATARTGTFRYVKTEAASLIVSRESLQRALKLMCRTKRGDEASTLPLIRVYNPGHGSHQACSPANLRQPP